MQLKTAQPQPISYNKNNLSQPTRRFNKNALYKTAIDSIHNV